jgi:hypothetical protein
MVLRMKTAFPSFALLMALRVLVFGVTVQAGSLPTSSTQRSAGCHEQSHKTPLPQPKNYVCCQSGHDSLIVQPSTIAAPACHGFLARVISDPAVVKIGSIQSDQPFRSSGDPPISLALRI